jgi:hypothetical protein
MTVNTRQAAITLLSTLSLAPAVHAATWFVHADAAGSGTGGSWADAFTTLQPALAAAQAGDDIAGQARIARFHTPPATVDMGAYELQPPRGTADFNGDGDPGADQDIEAFFACLSGSCCPACNPGGADFNGDGDGGTDADIESFFLVLAGGHC